MNNRRIYHQEWRKKNIERCKKNALLWAKLNPGKINQATKKWRELNPDKLKESDKKHREKFSLKRAEESKSWRKINPERMKILMNNWKKSPAGKLSIKASSAKRHSKTKDLTKALVQLVYERNIKQHGRLTCYLCFIPVALEQSELEHKTPLCPRNKSITPGTNHIDNLDVACGSCNAKKHNKTIEEYKCSLIDGR